MGFSRVFLPLLSGIFILFLLILILPDAQAQSPTPHYNLIVDPNTIRIDVSPGSPATANPNIIIENAYFLEETISLSVTAPGMAGACSSEVTVPAGSTVTVPLTVVAQPKSERGQVLCSIFSTITHLQGIPYPIENEKTSTFITVIEQYSHVEIKCDSMINITAGESKKLDVEILNLGNGRDNIGLKISNKKELDDDGWKIEILNGTNEFEINRGESVRLEIEIKLVKNYSALENTTIKLKAKSKLAGALYKSECEREIVLRGIEAKDNEGGESDDVFEDNYFLGLVGFIIVGILLLGLFYFKRRSRK